jgi:hypothetical protein
MASAHTVQGVGWEAGPPKQQQQQNNKIDELPQAVFLTIAPVSTHFPSKETSPPKQKS